MLQGITGQGHTTERGGSVTLPEFSLLQDEGAVAIQIQRNKDGEPTNIHYSVNSTVPLTQRDLTEVRQFLDLIENSSGQETTKKPSPFGDTEWLELSEADKELAEVLSLTTKVLRIGNLQYGDRKDRSIRGQTMGLRERARETELQVRKAAEDWYDRVANETSRVIQNNRTPWKIPIEAKIPIVMATIAGATLVGTETATLANVVIQENASQYHQQGEERSAGRVSISMNIQDFKLALSNIQNQQTVRIGVTEREVEQSVSSQEIQKDQVNPYPIPAVQLRDINVTNIEELTSTDLDANPTNRDFLIAMADLTTSLPDILKQTVEEDGSTLKPEFEDLHNYAIMRVVYKPRPDSPISIAAIPVHFDEIGNIDVVFLADRPVNPNLSFLFTDGNDIRFATLTLETGIAIPVLVITSQNGTRRIVSINQNREILSTDIQPGQTLNTENIRSDTFRMVLNSVTPTPEAPLIQATIKHDEDLSQLSTPAVPVNPTPGPLPVTSVGVEVADANLDTSADYNAAFSQLRASLQARAELPDGDPNKITFDRSRYGFVDNRGRVWRPRMSEDVNDLESGWLETTSSYYSQTNNTTILIELNPEEFATHYPRREYRNLEFSDQFRTGIETWLQTYGSNLRAQNVYLDFVPEYTSTTENSPVAGVVQWDRKMGIALRQSVSNNNRFVRIYVADAQNWFPVDNSSTDEALISVGVVSALILADSGYTGMNPHEVIFGNQGPGDEAFQALLPLRFPSNVSSIEENTKLVSLS